MTTQMKMDLPVRMKTNIVMMKVGIYSSIIKESAALIELRPIVASISLFSCQHFLPFQLQPNLPAF